MGAIKAGVTVVTFNEKESIDALHSALKDSKCKGLIFSPSTELAQSGNEKVKEGASPDTRRSFIHKLMPELNKLYPGDPLKLDAYPNL